MQLNKHWRRFSHSMTNSKPYIIPFFIPFMGCPFTCVYCHQEKITNQESLLPSGEMIHEQILSYLKTRKPNRYTHTEVAFYGGTFTGLAMEQQHALLAPVQDFLRDGLVQGIRASTKPDYINPSIVSHLIRYGVDTLELGVQSMDDRVLKANGRGYHSEQVRFAVACMRDQGMKIGLQLMPGLLGADASEAIESTLKIISLMPDFVRVYPTVVIKETALATFYEQGRYQPWSLEEAIKICRKILNLYQEARIPVIKMGLEFSSDEREGIVAGPYHPNFRQLVEAYV